MSTNGRVDKQTGVYSHYEIICSKENEQTKLHVTRSMNYPNVMLKEKSHTRKSIYSMIRFV